jgi:tripartite-type tricarboxylate transporter receptor subunit TctC
MKPLLIACSILVWLVAACAPSAPSTAPTGLAVGTPASEYFGGKTVTLVVNFSAGGPTDIFGRLLARHLGKHVPGNPTVVVQNVPGAGGKIGANQVYMAARKDGLTIGVFTSPFANQILQGEGVQYDSAKFLWLGGISEGDVAFANASLGVTQAKHLAGTASEVIVGGFTPDSGVDISERTILDLWDVKYRYVSGYAGNAEARNALVRNEINFFQVSLTDWFSSVTQLVDDGSVVPIGQSGVLEQGEVVRDPRLPSVPTYEEIAVELKGPAVINSVQYRASVALLKVQDALLRAIVLPPGTDEAVVATLRKALADTLADDDFNAETRKSFGFELTFVPGPEAQALATEIVDDTDRQTLDYLKALARPY